MIKTAESSVLIMTTTQGLIRKAEVLKNVLAKAKKRGISIKIAAPLNDETTHAVDVLSKFGEVKNSVEASRFCIIDGKQIAFMLLDDEKVHPSYDAAVWVNTQLFASTLENFFNDNWNKLSKAS